jgi:hypothetical protein
LIGAVGTAKKVDSCTARLPRLDALDVHEISERGDVRLNTLANSRIEHRRRLQRMDFGPGRSDAFANASEIGVVGDPDANDLERHVVR